MSPKKQTLGERYARALQAKEDLFAEIEALGKQALDEGKSDIAAEAFLACVNLHKLLHDLEERIAS